MDGKRIKHFYRVINGATPKSGEASYWDGNIVWITPADYSTSDMYITQSRRMITEEGLASCGTTLVPRGSIIVSNRAPIGLISIAGVELCTSQGCKCLVPYKDIEEKYVYYYLSTQEIELNLLGRGTTFLELSSSDLSNFPLNAPPIEYQNAIVTYLDNKITQIDHLITDKEKLITLLKEERQAIISEAVTKGLDPFTPMKDSGIKWLGEIPAHWECKKIKYIFEIVKRLHFQEDRNVLSITQQGICIKNIDSNKGQLAQSYVGYQLVNINDFAMNSMDLLTGFVDCSPYEGVTSPDYRVFRFYPEKEQCHDYYKYLFQMCYTSKIFYGFGQGVSNFGRWRLQTDVFKNFFVPVPPPNEQVAISQYILAKTTEIDGVIEQSYNQISLLKEYRQSVISEAVTGKYVVSTMNISQEDKPVKQANLHFKRRVLAAKILDELCEEPTLGHVKLEKLLFLSEYCAQLDLHTQYDRHAAGPYNPKVLRSIDSQLKKAKWFDYRPSTDTSNKYTRMPDYLNYADYYKKYFDAGQRSAIDNLIRLFRSSKTIQCEIVATLYGAWNDFLLERITPSDSQIIDEVLSNWHEKKERISRERWQRALNWMKDNVIIPVGYGESTKGGAS